MTDRPKSIYMNDESVYPYIAGVFLCSPTNSTMFTECCHVAICGDQENCPHCKRRVVGADAESEYWRRRIRWDYAYHGKR